MMKKSELIEILNNIPEDPEMYINTGHHFMPLDGVEWDTNWPNMASFKV